MGPAKKPRSKCPACEKTVINLRARYCSNICQMEQQYRDYIERWKSGLETGNVGSGRNLQVSVQIKRYLREKHGEACSKCGWAERHAITGKVPVNVEHVDGDPFRSSEDNLTLLCPNCHSLTETFGALNKGRGRTKKMGP